MAMNQLRTYLASLNPQEQAAFAQKAGTSIGYLRKALCVGQRFGGVLARRLDEASNGAISRYALRPDIFGGFSDAHCAVAPSLPTPECAGVGG